MNDETVERRPRIHEEETREGPPLPAAREGGALLPARFRLLGKLGEGGMGSVLRAWDETTQREVAVKVLGSRNLSAGQRERFQREAELTAALEHPGIVRVHEIGVGPGGRPFIVYALVEGRNLGEVLPQVPLSERLRLLRDTAAALGHAHEAGVVHRDVKPSNVLVDEEGRVRVADFGLAAARHLDRMTQTGALLGTVAFMSPEQTRGERATARSDVWALGVVLYHALTDELPFTGAFAELTQAIQRADPDPPRALVSEVSVGLSELCLRCLSADPARRPADGAAFAAELDACLRGEQRRATGWLPLVAVVSLGLLLVVALLSLPGRAPVVEDVQVASPDPEAEPTAGLPLWFTELAGPRRPALPLPPGLSCSTAPGDYVHGPSGEVLVYVPPGRYPLGAEHPRALPLGKREVAGFFIGKFELRMEHYRTYLRARGIEDPRPDRDGDLPVNHLALTDAEAYCAWAGLRLPREIEWEVAARGEDERAFPWGNEDEGYRAGRANIQNPSRDTVPVGSFPAGASPFGCLDMAGNVHEWVSDPYGEDTDASGKLVVTHVVRGGAVTSSPFQCRSYYRATRFSTQGTRRVGLRVALSATPAWWSQLSAGRRPALPAGVHPQPTPGDYLHTPSGEVLVHVPAGRYLTGHEGSRGVALAERAMAGVFMGKTEVTAGRFDRWLKAQGRPASGYAPEMPASSVSLADARAYCAAFGLRLPNELEWEVAARGDDGRLWPWGNDEGQAGTHGTFGRTSRDAAFTPVGSLPAGASPFGCLDMAGNVHEWVDEPMDAASRSFSRQSRPIHIARGGAANSERHECQTFYRATRPTDDRTYRVGFRVALSAAPSTPDWWSALPAARRPALPLPEGLRFGEGEGEYVHAKDGSVLVYVPPGAFTMGTNEGNEFEQPAHERRCEGFFIGKFELTWDRYHRFCEATGRSKRTIHPVRGAEFPARGLTYFDAKAYCDWAGLRLPSEAEWEYAARGSDGRAWPWGDAPPRSTDARAHLHYEGYRGRAVAVGSFPKGASPFGCLDMCGNVREWVEGRTAPYTQRGDDMVVAALGVMDFGILRGGGFADQRDRARTFTRASERRERAVSPHGFRVARSLRSPRGSRPPWWARLPRDRRPPLPLPQGVRFGQGEGEYVNEKDGSVLVYVPPGTFTMGADGLRATHEPSHQRTCAGLFMGKVELTWGRYRRFCLATGRPVPQGQATAGEEMPARSVSFDDAQAYCEWAGLRLPTEVEWEYAARGTDGREWPWGDEPPRLGDGRANLGLDATRREPVPVGSFPAGASPFGCLDMCGNLREWTQSAPGAYLPSGELTPEEEVAGFRVVRGGSYRESRPLDRSRTHARSSTPRGHRETHQGFRVARDLR